MIDTLRITGDAQAWRELGFSVDSEGFCQLGETRLHFDSSAQSAPQGIGTGIASWTLRGALGDGPLDGLPTVRLFDHHAANPRGAEHPNSATSVDHVVVATPDFERTLAAVEAAGMNLRRTRETPSGMRQGFFRHGEAVLEVVGPAAPTGNGPAQFWGLVATVRDIDLAAQIAGARLGRVKDAVQPERRIATVTAEAGLSVRLAFITG